MSAPYLNFKSTTIHLSGPKFLCKYQLAQGLFTLAIQSCESVMCSLSAQFLYHRKGPTSKLTYICVKCCSAQ